MGLACVLPLLELQCMDSQISLKCMGLLFLIFLVLCSCYSICLFNVL
jgi:hypothetical protein